MAKQETNSTEMNEIVRNKSNHGFYSVVNTKTGALVNVYETRQEILNNIEKTEYIYLSNKANGLFDLNIK